MLHPRPRPQFVSNPARIPTWLELNPHRAGGWNKGITLDDRLAAGKLTQSQYDEIKAARRASGQKSTGQPLTLEGQQRRNKRLSEVATARGLGGHTSKHKLLYTKPDGTEVFLQSSYEIDFANILDKLGIEWTRPSPLNWVDESGCAHRYYPDFLVNNVYIDTKNDYLAVVDLPKINAVREQCGVDIRIVTKSSITIQYVQSLQHI